MSAVDKLTKPNQNTNMSTTFTTKYIRPTSTRHGHTNVFGSAGVLLGYFLRNSSASSRVHENYNFVSENTRFNYYFSARSHKAMLAELTELLAK